MRSFSAGAGTGALVTGVDGDQVGSPRLTDGDTMSMATRTGTQSRALGVGLAGRGLVQANGSSNEGRESLLIDFIVLVDVDRAPGVAFEA